MDDLTEKNDVLEAMVYVKYTYAYDDASEENQCTTGDLLKVTISNNNEYIVQDIDSTSVEVQMVKDSINNTMTVSARNSYDCYDAVDNYFEEIQSNADSLTEDIAYAEPIVEPEDDVLPLSTSVSYNAQTARDYGFRLGDHYENYIFNRASLDCTNFVSQCVWAGYGGTNGYSIPYSPSSTNSTCVKLKERVKNDYRMTSAWYGRMYGSKNGDPPSNFCGVVSFYDYVTTNTGNGPRANSYNNGKVYSSLSTTMNKGDVLQSDSKCPHYGYLK